MLVAAATVLPIGYLVVRAAEAGWASALALLARPRTAELILNSVLLVAGVGVTSLVLGVGTALLIDRILLPGPRVWWLVAALPIAVPSYVAAFALVALVPSAQGTLPGILVIALTTYPYVTLPTLAALARADHELAEVARSLGVSRARALATVTLPQVLPAALAGVLLCMLYALADFATPAMLRAPTLTVGVYSLFAGTLDRSAAAVLSLVLLALALAVVALEQRARRAADAGRPVAPVRRPPRPPSTAGATALAGFAVVAPVVAAVVLPIAVLLARLAGGSRYPADPAALAGAAFTTLGLGAATALLATLAALPIAVLGARHRDRWLRLVEAVSFLGQALPGVVVALALVFLSLRLTPWAYQSAIVLVACYVILFMPKALGSSRAAIQQVPTALEDSARTLGRGRLRTWLTVTAPGALPGIAAGALLAMTSAMKEVPATLMLRPIGVNTLATELWSKTTMGAYGAAAPAALLLVLIGLVPAWLLGQAGRR